MKEPDWSRHVEDLLELLAPLAWAGWDVPDSYHLDDDLETGLVLFETLRRGWMLFEVEYLPECSELRLLPAEGDADGPGLAISMLDEVVTVDLAGGLERAVRAVTDVAAAHGLLDATRLSTAGEEGRDLLRQLLALAYGEQLFTPAAEYRELDLSELGPALGGDPFFSRTFDFVVGFAGAGVVPDLVTDAAALGIAAWCWRNNTAVEAWHLPGDVRMARVNIAVTKVVRPHVDPFEGVDWDAVRAALTDPSWRLPDGTGVAEAFGEGWPEVRDSVASQVAEWKRLDEEVIGPEATLRLLTVGGSTSYTRQWWGQPRWPAMCRRIVEDAVAAGLTLPAPYDTRDGGDALVEDLRDPDRVSDDVLAWLIDPPGGVDGLRNHLEATAPVERRLSAALFENL